MIQYGDDNPILISQNGLDRKQQRFKTGCRKSPKEKPPILSLLRHSPDGFCAAYVLRG